MRAGKFFAVLCICLGIISGAIIPGPPEQRIFNVFFFGLIPALAFRVSGYLLSRLLLVISRLCEMIVAICLRCLARLTRKFINCVAPLVLDAVGALMLYTRHFLSGVYGRSHRGYARVHRFCYRVHSNVFELSCLLGRSAARFVIVMQRSTGEAIIICANRGESTCNVLGNAWGVWFLIIRGAIIEFSVLLIRSAARFIIQIQQLKAITVHARRGCNPLRNGGRVRPCSISAAVIEFSYSLIRSAARFFIGIQELNHEAILNALGTGWRLRPLIIGAAFLVGLGLGWFSVFASHGLFDVGRQGLKTELSIDAIVDRIIVLESSGDQNAKNKRSSARGLGQFLDQTWLDLIRAHRSDLATGRNQDAILELREDRKIAREITAVFTEQNAAILKKRGLPATPGALYLAHFAGAAGAVAILSAVANADAASIMAGADATGRSKRETIVKANPFLQNFTVADLRSWADRKMRIPGSY